MSSDLKKIDLLRSEIESLHKNLLDFILARRQIVDLIWAEKQNHQLDLTDDQRENHLIHQFDESSELKNDENLQIFYQNVVKNIIAENKAYLSRKAQK